MAAGIQLEGLQVDALSLEQVSTVRTALSNVLHWPLEGIVDVHATVSAECDRVSLTRSVIAPDGTTLPVDDLDPRYGDYFRVSSVSARPVYRQRGKSSGWWLYFGGRDAHSTTQRRWWMAGPTLGSMEAGLLAPEDVATPDAAKAWYSYDKTSGWTKLPGLSAECNPIHRTTVHFKAVTTRCNKMQASKIKFLPFELKTGANKLYASLLPAFQGQLRSVVLRQMHVTPCEPWISLAVAQGARVLPATLEKECARRMDHATMKVRLCCACVWLRSPSLPCDAALACSVLTLPRALR